MDSWSINRLHALLSTHKRYYDNGQISRLVRCEAAIEYILNRIDSDTEIK